MCIIKKQLNLKMREVKKNQLEVQKSLNVQL